MRIAVAGGTGWTGRLLVDALRAAGDETVVLARSTGVDVTTGAGLTERLEGVDALVDVTNVTAMRAKPSVEFFEAATTNLLAAEQAAGVGHHVALSIVGVDRVDFGYYLGKRRQEELVLQGAVPATVLRATQFHEFAAQMLERMGRLVLAPRMLSQPIAVAEVAAHLVDLVHAEPAGMAPELAGPDVHEMPDLIRRVARVRRDRRLIVPLTLPGRVGRGFVGGGLLPTGPGPRGTVTFDQWLAAQQP